MMVDYYFELNINPSISLEEINRQLSQLESTWKRREITNPEKATTMLALIIAARKVFQNDATKADYDFQLRESTKKPSQYSESEKLAEWKQKASKYLSSGQYDLAKTAIERALSCPDISQDDTELYYIAAKIYCENGIVNTAMDYINKSIVSKPDIAMYYIIKGWIFEKSASVNMSHSDYSKINGYYNSARQSFEIAINKAQQSGDKEAENIAKGVLAYTLYFHLSLPQEAEQLARQATDSGNDTWGNSKRVLDDIAKKKAEQKQKQQEESRQAEERAKEESHRRQIAQERQKLTDEQKKLLSKESRIRKSTYIIESIAYFAYVVILLISWPVEGNGFAFGLIALFSYGLTFWATSILFDDGFVIYGLIISLVELFPIGMISVAFESKSNCDLPTLNFVISSIVFILNLYCPISKRVIIGKLNKKSRKLQSQIDELRN